jgi:hypothetical protein
MPVRAAAPSRPAARVLAVVAALVALAGCGGSGPGADLSGAPRPASTLGARGAPSTTATTVAVDPAIADVMAGAGMTDEGRRLFLQAQPSLEDHDGILQSCVGADATGGPEGAHTFGCVADGHIHVRTFTAPEIRDLTYVVAAHELLHVVYGRMAPAERARIDAELDSARSGNTVLEERLAVYAAVDEDSRNEVHSVLGTEFANLSPVLEDHYSRYFDRARVLAAFARTLGQREEAIRGLEATVKDTEAQIEPLEAQMDAFKAAGDLRDYNAQVPVVNALVSQHNAALDDLQSRVNEYNNLLAS